METKTSSLETLGQPHTQRRRIGFFGWARRLLLGLVILLVALCSMGATYQVIATARDAAAYPAPGQLVDVGGYKLHILCSGTGSPTVILEAGLANISTDWAWVQPEVAQTTRVCAYDRAGNGWSDPGPAPRDPRQIAHELHTLLGNAGIPGPYVLVALSSNSLYQTVEGATHSSLQFDEQTARVTSGAIRQVIEAARSGQPLVTP